MTREPVRSTNDWRVAEVAPGLSLMLTTWPYVLDRLKRAAEDERDQASLSDLLQLQSLAARQDAEVFMPIRREELAPDTPRRLLRLVRLVDVLIGQLGREPEFLQGSVSQAFGYYGRYLDDDRKLWVGFWLQRWETYGVSPIWFQMRGDASRLSNLSVRLQDLERRGRLIREAGQLLVPLVIPVEREQPDVLADLVAQVRAIAVHLGSS